MQMMVCLQKRTSGSIRALSGLLALVAAMFIWDAVSFAEGELVATSEAPAADNKQPEAPAVRFDYTERPIKGSKNPVEFRYRLEPTKASEGKIVRLAITMKLDEGWHTFPTNFEGEGGSPTEIDLKTIYGLKSLDKDFKPDRTVEVKKEDNLELQIYHHEVSWIRDFEILPEARKNGFGVEGAIKYQVCTNVCVPKSGKFTVGVTSDEIEPPAEVEFYDGPEPVAVADPPKGRLQDKGLLPFLLAAMAAGMVALVTPCVFPMVPITVSFFLKQSEAKGGKTFALAFVFSLSIVAAFVVIGVGVAAIFGATKLNELANNWALNLFLAAVFFVFALNMMGLFEIQVPSWLLSLTASGEQTGGYVGVIFMALTFVLTSFSCTFAFVGSLIVAASQGEYYWPILGMSVFGGTFAAPFFLLAMMPGMLKSLPKSGGWLNAVKVTMGFVELGVTVKYISVVDQVWHSVPWIFDFTNVMILWAVLSFCTGLYLLGMFRLSHDSQVQTLSPLRVLWSIAFLVFGCLFIVGLANPERETWIVDQIVAFAPARLENDEFEKDFDRAVAEAVAQNRPLFVDFTGVNCMNCRLMEKRMAKPKNHKRLEQFTLAQLFTDKVPKIVEKAEEERLLQRNRDLQENWFGDASLPGYVIATPDGKTILATFLGLESRDGDFARFLDEGMAKWKSLGR